MTGRSDRKRWSVAVVLMLALLGLRASDAPAASSPNPAGDLESSNDFRVRVAAALTLGRTHAPGALGFLQHALGDVHPAVRIATAVALGALGDPAAIPALHERLAREPAASVRAQITAAVTKLEAIPSGGGDVSPGFDARWQGARYVLAIGDMNNRMGVHGDHASQVLRTATRSRAQSIRGALVSETNDPVLFEQAAARHVPVLMIDGALARLSRSEQNAQLSYSAQVDYSIRRVPQQQLKGTLSGSATSFGSLNALHDPGSLTQLADQAIEGAVESALRGADQGFVDASR